MKLSLHSTILGEDLSIANYVALAGKCGYAGVDFDIGEIMSLALDDLVAAAEEIFSAHGIAPAAPMGADNGRLWPIY